MNREEATTVLRDMLFAAQKARSNIAETGLGDNEDMLATLQPWLWGTKSILPLLSARLSAIEAGGSLTGLELYNFMWVAKLTPLILAGAVATGRDLPEPDPAWMAETW